MSAVIAAILRPLTEYIANFSVYSVEIPRFIAVIISFLTLIILVSFFLVLFIPLVSDQVEVISAYNYEYILTIIEDPISRFEKFLIDRQLVQQEIGFISQSIRSGVTGGISSLDLTVLFNNVLSITGNIFIGMLAVIFITFIFLHERGFIRNTLLSWVPNQYFEVSTSALYKVERLLSNYLLGLLFQMASIFTIASIILSILGVNYAITIALFAAIANVIPYLGPVMGATFGIVVGFTSSGLIFEIDRSALILVLKIMGTFGIVQLTDNLFLQPLIFSRSVKAHPLEIFVIIFAGAKLAGILGMIIAIPVYTILRVSWIELFRGYKEYQIFK